MSPFNTASMRTGCILFETNDRFEKKKRKELSSKELMELMEVPEIGSRSKQIVRASIKYIQYGICLKSRFDKKKYKFNLFLFSLSSSHSRQASIDIFVQQRREQG